MPMFSNVSRNSLSKTARSDLNRSNNSSIFESDGQVGGKVVIGAEVSVFGVGAEKIVDRFGTVEKSAGVVGRRDEEELKVAEVELVDVSFIAMTVIVMFIIII